MRVCQSTEETRNAGDWAPEPELDRIQQLIVAASSGCTMSYIWMLPDLYDVGPLAHTLGTSGETIWWETVEVVFLGGRNRSISASGLVVWMRPTQVP